MEQDINKNIKILEDYIYNKKETMKEQLVKAIEHLIKAYKELEEENTELKECLEVTSKALDNVAYDQIPIAIADLMIPKALVEETIEELKQYKLSLLKENYVEKQKEFKSQNVLVCNAIRDIAVTGKIDILQELLEKR